MPKRTKQPVDPDKLQREQAGAYRTIDGRFSVTSQGGEWFVTDSERVDGFGLELVVGPLRSLAEAKAALAEQRAEPQGHTIEESAQLARKAATEAARAGGRTRGKREDAKRASSGTDAANRTAPEPEPEPEPPKRPRAARSVQLARWRKRRDERDDVAAALRRINDAWTRGEPEAAAEELHPEVVFVQAGFTAQVEGREAAVESYREFMTDAIVHEYSESGLEVHVWDRTAVATHRWAMDWEMDGEKHEERGHDVFVFTSVSGRWLAAWRLLGVEGSTPAG